MHVAENQCYHCGNSIISRKYISDGLNFCCGGCQSAYAMVKTLAAENYYRFRESFSAKPVDVELRPLDLNPSIDDQVEQSVREMTLIVRGMHCPSCAWLCQKVIQSHREVSACEVNFSNATVRVTMRDTLEINKLNQSLAILGYELDTQSGSSDDARSVSFLKKMTVAGFFSGNIMLISVSLFSGFFGAMDQSTKQIFHLLSFFMASITLYYSASVFFRTAWESLKHRMVHMDLLISTGLLLAYIYSTVALIKKEGEVYYDAICFVTFVVLLSRYLEIRFSEKIMRLINQRKKYLPSIIQVEKNGQVISKKIADLSLGETLIVPRYETLPVDSVLLSESAILDESVITGESTPIKKKFLDRMISGSKNLGGEIKVKVSAVQNASTAQILTSMSNRALDRSSRAEINADRAVRWFSFSILALAGINVAWWLLFNGAGIEAALISTMALLIAACPCAMGIAIPSAYLAAINRLAERGIIIKESQSLGDLKKIEHIIFDKTGTLTHGNMSLSESIVFDNEQGLDLQRALQIAASMQAAHHAEHPIRDCFLRAASVDEQLNFSQIQFRIGEGLFALEATGKSYLLGSENFLKSQRVSIAENNPRMNVHLAINSKHIASFTLSDEILPDAKEAIHQLQSRGLICTILSGDVQSAVSAVAHTLNVAEYRYAMKPVEKAAFVKKLREQGLSVMVVGDGINDAPAFAEASISVSFLNAPDILSGVTQIYLLKRSPLLLTQVFSVAESLHRKVFQNLVLSVGYNVALLPLAILGMLNPFVASVSMSLSSVVVSLNSLRVYFGRN